MMNRTVKLIGIAVALFALFLGLSLLIQRWVVYPQFQQLQDLFIEDAEQRLRLAIEGEQKKIDLLAGDYAMWDDTIDFIQSPGTTFVESNFPVESYARGLFDLVWILDGEGRFVYRGMFDPDNGELDTMDMDAGERIALGPGHPFLQPLVSRVVQGIYHVDNAVYQVSVRPVVRSDGSGAPKGVVVMGRRLDASHMEALSGLVSMPVSMHEAMAAPPWSSSDHPVHRTLASGALESWTVLPDIYGEPGIALMLDAPRKITAVGRRALMQGMVAVMAQGLLFLAIGLVYQVRSQRKSQRVELARQLEERTTTLRETEQYLKTIMETVPVGIVIVDASRHTILDINPAALRLLGVRREDAVGKISHTIMHDARAPEEGAENAGGIDDPSATVITRGNGTVMPVFKTVAPTLLRGRNCLLVCFVDITEQKAAEDRINQSLQDMSRINRSMIGREERILELKREVNTLLSELGRVVRYRDYVESDNGEKP
jgi:PAS domain S-box-containing protein